MLSRIQHLIPNPLHPAVVHFPIAVSVLLPIFAIGAMWAISRGARPLRAWGMATAMYALLSLSAWVSLQTGQSQEDRVERVVSEAAIGTHEEAAERFLAISVAALVIAGIGLGAGRIGAGARVLATVGSLGMLVAGYDVGHSGGQLVYVHGAASAYASPARVGEGGGTAGAVQSAERESDR